MRKNKIFEMIIILEQILKLSILAILGILAVKLKFLKFDYAEGISKLLIKITIPLLVFTTFSKFDISSVSIINFFIVIVFSIISTLILYILSLSGVNIFKLDDLNAPLHKVQTMFGNVVFLGFPLINSLFPGGEGLIYAALFQLGHDAVLWTLGIVIIKNDKDNNILKEIKHLLNPVTISFILGVIFMLLKIPIPDLIFNPLFNLGHTTIYISMIYVGIILTKADYVSLLKNKKSYFLSLNKLLIGPLIVLGILFMLRQIGISINKTAALVIVLQTAMPCMIIISVLAQEFGLSVKQSVENIFVTSVLSIITLPLLFYLSFILL